MPYWEVHSFQLNIDEGDSAVHLLVDREEDPKNIETAVLIDGGKPYGADCILGFRTILNRDDSGYTQGQNRRFQEFDAIVISHWDGDHRDGIVQALQADIEEAALKAIKLYNITNQDEFNRIIEALKIKSTLTKYNGDLGEPSTVIYAPYWRVADSRTHAIFNKTEKEHPNTWIEMIDKDKRSFVGIKVELRSLSGYKVKGAIPVALLKYDGKGLLGLDFFSGQVVMNAAEATCPAVVSQRLSSINYSKPVMLCVAADSWVCDPGGMADRLNNWRWEHNRGELTDIHLARKTSTSFRSDAQNRGLAQDQSSCNGEISIQSVTGTTTGNNQASIACMIIWPHQECDVSLYSGGDLGDEMEQHVLRWSTIPSAADINVRTAPRVDCLKLSHHGSKFSTPALMLLIWRPDWIMSSNGMKANFNHISWDTAYLCLTYTYWYNATIKPSLFHRPLMTTNFPIYLTKYILADDVGYINSGAIDSLTKPVGIEWRDTINKMWTVVNLVAQQLQLPPRLPVNLLNLNIPGNEKEAKTFICSHLDEWWNEYSFIPRGMFGGWGGFENGMNKAAAQTIRFFAVKQGSHGHNQPDYAFGTSFLDISLLWLADITYDSIVAPIDDERKRMRVAKTAVNDKTKRNIITNRLAKKTVTGSLMDSGTAQILNPPPAYIQSTRKLVDWESDESGPPKESALGNPILFGKEQRITPRSLVAGPALCYFMATDTIETKGPVKSLKAKTNASLDLFLSGLTTGAIVLPDKLDVKASEFWVDGSDELLQWLLSIFGDFEDSKFAMKAKASTANISCFSYTTRLDKATAKGLSFSDKNLSSMVTFSTDNNAVAFSKKFTSPPAWLGPPASDTADADIDIIGPAFMLLMGLSSSSGIEHATITGKEIIDLFEVKLPTALHFFSSLMNFNVDTKAGTKCGLWFFPDAVYTTVLRLQFKAANGDPTSSLKSKLKDTIKDITSVVLIDVDEASVVAKKTWRRSQNPAKEASADVESNLVIFAPVKFHRQPKAMTHLQPKLDNFTVDTALEVVQEKTNFILTFDASKGGTSITDLLEFFISLLPGNPGLPSLTEYLPGINIDSILLRRITYVLPAKGRKVVTVDLQAGWASMVLQCTLKYRFGEGGGAEFGGSLFLNDQQSQLGPRFSFVPYMPGYENWTALTIVPKAKGGCDGKQVGNLGDIYSTLTKAEGSEKKLENAPVSLQLLALGFYINSQDIHFKATVISPPKDDKDSVPQIRLSSATLDVLFNYKKPQLQRLAFYSTFILAPRNSDGYATLGASLEYASNKWTLRGSAGRLSGALLYSLFDSRCKEEMLELLKHISLDVTIKYNYDSNAKGSDFLIWGGLHLGPVTLDYEYNYKGETNAKDEPIWTLTADLSVDKGDGTLIDIIDAICGTDAGKLLPSWLKDVRMKTSGDKKLTSLRILDAGTSIFFVLRVQLNGGASIAFYRLSQKKKSRNNPGDEKPPVTKTALALTVDKLPTVENIPLIGSLPQPFDELDFVWVTSNDEESSGFTRADMQIIANCRAQDDPRLRYKDNVKKDQQKDTDMLLASGYHFIIVANQKIVLDCVFGRKKDNKDEKNQTTKELSTVGEELELGIRSTATSPIDKTLGPVKVFGLGLGFDVDKNILSIVIDGTLTLGPLAMTLLGFGINFCFDGNNLRDLASVRISPDLRGLGASFQRDPVLLQGMFEKGVSADGDIFFQGAATVGFTPYLFQAVGYYGKARDSKPPKRVLFAEDETFNTFFTYCRLDGPIMTIFGFAELTGLSGGFGYNSTIGFPSTQNLLNFPFIAPPDESDPSKALYQFLHGGWFMARRDSYWMAAGFKVLAFEMLEVQAVLTVEFGTGLKFGLFGLATAEMPKKVKKKFVRVQLGLAATVDFDAGVMKIDGQLTPSSFVLDPSCRLTGGFAMYSWFDSRDLALDGDWVFTIGGYHKSFKVPTQYPVPPRLGITWSFDDSINITGESYFAINTKVCMGGGRLHIVMSAGSLYAYFDAYADFLINYKPFHFQAEGGISVGVHYTLDLWLVTTLINIDLAARLYLQGPPVNGTVHVDFYVFGFDVNFGERQVTGQSKLPLEDFYRLALQADNKAMTKSFFTQEEEGAYREGVEVKDDADKQLSPHIFSCTSGLIPSEGTRSSPNDMVWNVRGAVFAFDISCKFALTKAKVITKSLEEHGTDVEHPVPNKATDKMYAKPMWLSSIFYKSKLKVTIAKDVPAVKELTDDPKPLNPEWDNNTGILTSVPTALWGAYNPADDPSSGNNNIDSLLDGTKGGTAKLLTGVTIHAPTPRRSDDIIAEFDVQIAMGRVAGLASFACKQDAQETWQPQPKSANPYKNVRTRWNAPLLGADAGIQAAETWCTYAAFQWGATAVSGKRPKKLIAELERQYTESPHLSADDGDVGTCALRSGVTWRAVL